VTELATGDASRETPVADGDLLIYKLVREAVSALGHGTDEDAHALLGAQVFYPVSYAHQRGIEAEGDLTAVGRKVVGDRVLDDTQQLLLRRGRSNREAVEELNHQTGEALEGTRDSDGGRDLDQDTLGRANVYLQFAGLVDGRVKQGEEALG
jgi:hypothetical protein